MSVKPSLQAMWLADDVSQDPETGKTTISGIFDSIEVSPGTDFSAGASLFFSLRDIHAQVDLTLLYVDLAGNEVLVERPIQVSGQPLLTTDVCIQIPRMPVPHPGQYAWELHFKNEMLGSCRIIASFASDKGS